MPDVTSYTWTSEARTVDAGEVDGGAAIKLLDSVLARSGTPCHSVEEQVANTVFGLEKPSGTRLEISAFALNRIHVSFEARDAHRQIFFGLMTEPFSYERTLESRTAAVEVIRKFLVSTDEEMKEYLERTFGRESWWSHARR